MAISPTAFASGFAGFLQLRKSRLLNLHWRPAAAQPASTVSLCSPQAANTESCAAPRARVCAWPTAPRLSLSASLLAFSLPAFARLLTFVEWFPGARHQAGTEESAGRKTNEGSAPLPSLAALVPFHEGDRETHNCNEARCGGCRKDAGTCSRGRLWFRGPGRASLGRGPPEIPGELNSAALCS